MKQLLAIALALVFGGCRAEQPEYQPETEQRAGLALVSPKSDHVFVVVEENRSYPDVIGSSTMPFFNSLANKYGLATQFYANTHPSIGNYFMLTTGQIVTNNDSYTGTVGIDNIVRHLNKLGKTWKVYADSLPSVGYLGGDSGNYVKRHNPFAYLTDVRGVSTQAAKMVPATQFAKDLAAGTLPNFSFIIPNILHDAHSASRASADAWLKTFISPLLASKYFQTGADGVLYVIWDEGVLADKAKGGGHIANIVVGPSVRPAFKSTVVYQHQSLLRIWLEHFADTGFPGAAATAPSMSEFFEALVPPPPPPIDPALGVIPPNVTQINPIHESIQASPVLIQYTSTDGVRGEIWLDRVRVWSWTGASTETKLVMGDGIHRFVAQSWDASGKLTKVVETVTVNNQLRPTS